jgi:putative two-component system response regulator
VTPAPGIRAHPLPIDILESLGSRAAQLDRRELAGALAPLVEGLQEPLPAPDRAVVGEAVMAFCRRLYSGGRSGDALPLGAALLAQAIAAGDPVLERRAAGVCGLLASDTMDIVSAVDYQMRALKLAQREGNPVGLAGVWNNIGLAFSVAGNYDLSTRCFRRAITTVVAEPGPVHVRYTAASNLANGLFHVGELEEGLRFGQFALHAAQPGYATKDPHGAILLRRNLIWLLVASERVGEAKVHADEIAALSQLTTATRSLIAAATARASYELATGQADIALTRLDDALARARSVPAALRDTLACAVRAEESAGNAERALLRLQELSDHVYRFAIERARDHVELAGLFEAPGRGVDPQQEQARARLVPRLRAPGEPEEWKAYQRLGVAAVLRMDSTGWHGIRVGALTKALALAHGIAPLQALEIGLAAELHDIGLVTVPEAILAKRGELNDAERALVERHTDAGAEILRNDDHPRILLAREVAKYHHARWDGTGYPERVGGRFIPLPARMCAVADAYDSMVCGLDGRQAVSMNDALEELRREAGRQFDPELVDRFGAMIRDETADLGVDPGGVTGLESFQELVVSLHEDRGFI